MGGPVNVDLEQYTNASGEAPVEAKEDKGTVVEAKPEVNPAGTDVIVENASKEE